MSSLKEGTYYSRYRAAATRFEIIGCILLLIAVLLHVVLGNSILTVSLRWRRRRFPADHRRIQPAAAQYGQSVRTAVYAGALPRGRRGIADRNPGFAQNPSGSEIH